MSSTLYNRHARVHGVNGPLLSQRGLFLQLIQQRHSNALQSNVIINLHVITFRVSRRRREMYGGYGRVCVCVCVCVSVCLCVCLSLAAFPHYCTDLDVTW